MSTSRPASREELKSYCLRKLGYPVVEINIEETQLEDCIDDALQHFAEYHFDGTERDIVKHQITASEALAGNTQGYLEFTVPASILSIRNVFNLHDSFTSSDLFNPEYQLVFSALDYWNDLDLVQYNATRNHFALVDWMFNANPRFEFRHVKNKVRVYAQGEDSFASGSYIVFDVYRVIDPDTYTKVYDDIFVKRYATSLAKKQWGQNLIKFEGMQLPGGVQFNGRQIYEDATQELEKIEEEMQLKYEEPPMGLFG